VDNDCFGITAIPFCMASAVQAAGPVDLAPTILQPRIRNMSSGQNEAFSRILIDKALEFSGWELLNPRQVQFELHTSNGRADYLLKDKLGRVLCVLEAKREDLDPYDAKEQARG